MTKKVIIRANAGPQIGYGHIVRCTALAESYRDLGHEVVFLTNDMHDVVSRSGFSILVLKSNGNDALDFRKDKVCLRAYGISEADILVVDSYSMCSDYFVQAHSVFNKCVAMDDLGWNYPGVDIILNGNIYANDLVYQTNGAIILAGPQYCLIRNQFAPFRGKAVVKPDATDVLIMMGGSDPRGLTMMMVKLLHKNLPNLHCHVIIGQGLTYSILSGMECTKITLYSNPGNLPEIMVKADFAISAAGSTLYELGFLGLPSVNITVAKNQEMIARAADARGFSASLGWYESVTDASTIKMLQQVSSSKKLRDAMSSSGRTCIDGKGSDRAVHCILDSK